MTLQDNLLFRAEAYWLADDPLPTDLFAALLGAGVDVEAEEKKFNLIKEYL